MLLRQVYDNLGRPSQCDSSECDSSDSSDPPFCWETLRRTMGALTRLLFCCGTFRRAAGALIALTLPFRSFLATAVFFGLAYVKAAFESHSLGICLQSQRSVMPPFYVADMEYFPSTGLKNKHFRGTLVQHGVCR